MSQTSIEIPDSVKGEAARQLYAEVNQARVDLKQIASAVAELRAKPAAAARLLSPVTEAERIQSGEAIANVALAYRHIEDASMRLGKALQALDGGVSVYDKASTVGA